MIKLILVLLAILFFILAGFSVQVKGFNINWTGFGLAAVTAAVLLPL